MPVMKWIPHGWRILLLWALLLAVYSNSFQAALIFDNDLAILRDTRLHAASADNVRRILSEGFWLHEPNSGLYRSVTSLSFLLNYSVLGNGPNPAGYHWLNLILHGLNATLVYALIALILGS